MSLPVGKLPYSELKRLLSIISKPDPSVVLGPGVGEDAALIDLGDRVLVVHSDPITGAVERIGWYSVHVSANDVATRGARPKWLTTVILLPEGSAPAYALEIARQAREAADEIGAVIVGGHTEVTPGLDRPIVVSTAFGVAEKGKVVSTANAQPGDVLVLTKGAGIEGTAILASEFRDRLAGKVSSETLERAKLFVRELSVVREAMLAVEVGGVHAMHDATEGGVLGAVQEMAIASGLSAVVFEEQIPVRSETAEICRILGCDPLRLISSGSLLIAVEPGRAGRLLRVLSEAGVPAANIGRLERGEGLTLVRKGGVEEKILEPITDELWRLLSQG